MVKLLKILSLVILPGFLFFHFVGHCYSQSDPPIVFVTRNLEHNGSQYYQQSGLLPGMGPFSRLKAVGGRLLIRQSNGSLVVLVDSTMSFNGITLIDVQQPCVFWDASKIVFAGIENRDSSWRIYEIHSDGSGFRKITYTNRNINLSQFGSIANLFAEYDDIDPCYLPDGRICFASTRYPSFSEFGFRTTNLYVINSDGSNIHRITTERNGAEKPTVDPVSGRIVFSRWWLNIDLPSRLTPTGLTRDTLLALTADDANIWQAGSIRPDGDAISLYAGHPETRTGLYSYKPFIMSDGSMLSIFVPYTSMTNTSGSPGIRWYSKGTGYPNYIAGVNAYNMQLYIQNPPSFGTMIPPYATDPVQLADGRILFSYATQVENQDYGLYTININGTGLTLFYDIPGKLELNARVLLSKTVPPILQDNVTDVTSELPPTIDPNTYFENGGFRFDCVNIFTNGDIDQPITDAPPITKNAKIDFFLNFQRQNPDGRDSAIFLTRLPLDYSGAIHFDLAPGDVAMFEQVIDSTGKVVSGSKGQIAHVSGMNFGRPGTGTKCVGCHAGHTTLLVPPTISEGQYFNASTSANVTQSSFRYINDSLQYPGKKAVDRKARIDSLTVNWIATGANNEFVDLRWDVPIDVRNLIIYNIKPNTSSGTNIQVNDCEIFLSYQNSVIYHVSSTGIISVNGTKIGITGEPKIDEAKITVTGFTGTITNQSVAGLAEIVTDAKVSYYDVIGIKPISFKAKTFQLEQNFPNPFNPSTKIRYSIPNKSSINYVKLIIYDIIGREVKTLVNQVQGFGTYEILFNAQGLASGIYFYKLVINNTLGDNFTDVRKMVVLK